MIRDREALDAQMRFAAILPDFAERLAWMARESDAFAATTRLARRAYGPDPRQWLEQVDAAPRGEVRPVFVHGGYWRALDAAGHRFALRGLAALGAPAANVEYRLMPATRMADLIADVDAALDLLLADDDPRPLVIVGHSAGAHLALEALRARHRRGDAVTRCQLAAISGVYDLESVARSFLQDELALTADEIARHSPLGDLPPAAILAAVGADETPFFLRESKALAAGAKSAVHVEAGKHHMTVLEALLQADSALSRRIAAFALGKA